MCIQLNSLQKQSHLNFKNRPKQLLGSLLFDFVLPAYTALQPNSLGFFQL